jgi:hydroxyacyl-ACP dehydratase HTD2-like protein with hotdog domain
MHRLGAARIALTSLTHCRRIRLELQSSAPARRCTRLVEGLAMAGLLTLEARAWLGRTAPPLTEMVSRREIRKYSIATGQRLPKYLHGDEAPPMFHAHFFQDLVLLEEMQPDGQSPNELTPPLPLQRVMAGGREIEYFRPIVPGDTLTATRTRVDLYEKDGRSGPLIFVVIEMRVTDAQGKPVVTEKRTRIMR